MITVLAITAMAIGLLSVLRAVVIIATGDIGLFPLDPWLSLIAGFALIVLGRLALNLTG